MFEYIKQEIITRLNDEIQYLDAVSLELVGHQVVRILEGGDLIHHGINADYKPSGYTVDSFSNDSTVIAEYSTDASYFKNSGTKDKPYFEKIETDIKKAINHNARRPPDRIYLVSSLSEPPSFRGLFNRTDAAQENNERLIIYDARELAKIVYEQSINNPKCADYYCSFLPGLSQDLDNYEYYGKIPAQAVGYVHDCNLMSVIQRHYAEQESICILHGVSGCGKTQAAIDFVHRNIDEFFSYIWISGDDWPADVPLSAIKRTRGGQAVNVAGLFNSTKAVLVIDSVERLLDRAQFEELKEGFDRGGVVLATSQLGKPGDSLYLPMPKLQEEVSIAIVGESVDSASELSREFITMCQFSPLVLATTRNIIEEEGVEREELYREVLEAPERLPGPDGLSIMNKILSRLDESAEAALKKIARSGSCTHDIQFLRQFIGNLGCVKLQRLSILVPGNAPGIVRIHELVHTATSEKPVSSEIAEAVECFLESCDGDMRPSILREIHLVEDQLKEEHASRGSRSPDWLVYALLQIDGETKNNILRQIYELEPTAEMDLGCVKSIIDAQEAYSYTIDDHDERKAYYETCGKQYTRLAKEVKEEKLEAEFLHHAGKALRRCEDYEGALARFQRLLELRPGWHATHGQIAHLGTQYGVSDAVKEYGHASMRQLLSEVLNDASMVPLRVSLGALARLRSYRDLVSAVAENRSDVERLADVIAMAALEGLGQFYEAFVSFTSMFGYHHREICVGLAENVAEMLVLPPNAVERNQWVSACEALSNIAVSADRANKTDLARRVTEASIAFADAVAQRDTPKPFAARAAAKTFLRGDMPDRAIDTIQRVPGHNENHWLLYRMSEAESKIGRYNAAVDTAKQALALAEGDTKASQHVAAYHDRVSRCYEDIGDRGSALSTARLAVKRCADPTYREELSARVQALESEQ